MNSLLAALQQFSERGSRSTALKPLGQLATILSALLVGAIWQNSPSYIIICIFCLLCLDVIAYIGSYTYFMLHGKDYLRSESFVIDKMSIEKRLIGDSVVGTTVEGRFASVPQVALDPPSDDVPPGETVDQQGDDQ